MLKDVELLALLTKWFWTAVVLSHMPSSCVLSYLCHLILTLSAVRLTLIPTSDLLHVFEHIVKRLSTSDFPISKDHEYGSIGTVES